MAVTIRDVARLADVGIGTVSRVINDSPLVSDSTRRRVLHAMEELDYAPNPFARRLPLGKSLTFAVIAPFFTRPSVVERLRGIEAAIADTEYDLVVYNAETIAKRDKYFREVCRPGGPDGIVIVTLVPSGDDIVRFEESGSIVVLIDAEHPALPRIQVDDVAGGRMATEHLLSLGHERVAFLGDAYPNPFRSHASHDRYLGYKQALSDAGIPIRTEYVVTGEHGRDEARAMARSLLELSIPPTAIFATSDTQALGVLEAARASNVRVPRDLSVVGYDDIEIAEHLELTTVRQPLFETGWEGVQLLFKYLERGPRAIEPYCQLMPIELIIRGTTAPPQ